MAISPITEIIADIRAGKMVILVDEEDRENEGDLVLAAEFVSAEAINFMARYGRGLICLTLTEEKCRSLNLPLMVASNQSPLGTNFTVSIEAAEGVTTGISAADRARTVQAAVRAGHTEAGCDLAQLAGAAPAAVICEVLKDNGEMARLPDLVEFAAQHQLKIGTIADLIHHRGRTESLVQRVSERDIETVHGKFRLIVYSDKIGQATHLALVKGRIKPDSEVLVRVHEPLSVIDLLDTRSASHSWNFNQALAAVSRAECGVIVLLHRPESAADLLERAQPGAIAVPQKKALRTYGIGAQILRDLKVAKMRLLAKPRRMPSMAGFDLQVTGYLQPEEANVK